MIDWASIAALNNAEWCDAICRAHGTPGTFAEAAWFNTWPTPRFYPNLVTLRPGAGEAVAALVASLSTSLTDGFAVKDSFADLDLAPLGFRVLFEAQWIHRPPAADVLVDDGLDWSVVNSEPELAAWEAAWSNGEPGARIFLPPLLLDRSILLIQGRQSGAVVAGAALNRSERAMGWSNVFGSPQHRAGALALAHRLAGSLPLVGYESGGDLEHALALGFEPVGPLRIWAK